jgi:hypothetical protein
MFSNPLREVDEDQFVLHFYDLSAQQPHSFYRFAFAPLPPPPPSTA